MDLTRRPCARVIAGLVLAAIITGCAPAEPVGEVSVRFELSAVEVTGLSPTTLRKLGSQRSPEEWA